MHVVTRHAAGVLGLVGWLLLGPATTWARADGLDALYARIATDVAAGQPLRIRIYVALCDNDSQGIVPVNNPAICDGERPAQNIYWGTSGGLHGFVRRAGFRRVHHERRETGPVAIRARFEKTLWAGPRVRGSGGARRVRVEIDARVYRGLAIRQAMADYIAAVHGTGTGPDDAHVIGYIGHNYLLDTEDTLIPASSSGARPRPVGAFALSCYGDSDIRPSITIGGVPILLLNRGLTYPGAWTVGGLASGLARGVSAARLHALASDAFARGKGRRPGSMRRVFAYGPW